MTQDEIIEQVDTEVGSRPESILDYLEALECAASLTADHLTDNWQDKRAASAWETISAKIQVLHDEVNNLLPF